MGGFRLGVWKTVQGGLLTQRACPRRLHGEVRVGVFPRGQRQQKCGAEAPKGRDRGGLREGAGEEQERAEPGLDRGLRGKGHA